MEILIITGLSGGGKSRAASYLEDIGYYTVDNLPAEMMVKFADFCAGSSGRYDRVAPLRGTHGHSHRDAGAPEGQRRQLPDAVSGGR